MLRPRADAGCSLTSSCWRRAQSCLTMEVTVHCRGWWHNVNSSWWHRWNRIQTHGSGERPNRSGSRRYRLLPRWCAQPRPTVLAAIDSLIPSSSPPFYFCREPEASNLRSTCFLSHFSFTFRCNLTSMAVMWLAYTTLITFRCNLTSMAVMWLAYTTLRAVVFVKNATAGVNAVVRALTLHPGDACLITNNT
eukprot:SAG31_NODE_581_length_13927_cov_78.549899_1_plen_192_part_00